MLPEKIGVLGMHWKDKHQQERSQGRNIVLYPFPRRAKGKQVKGDGGHWYLQITRRDEETLQLTLRQ